ncbi:hypothetical protein SB775_18740 [Peribacillus sp. SIMBA_075]|uniref:hypothetical protein n=1 Tax=Peribacillus sp. SIMBA_075 TaxID=3085813 RepID=UPI0039791A43
MVAIPVVVIGFYLALQEGDLDAMNKIRKFTADYDDTISQLNSDVISKSKRAE